MNEFWDINSWLESWSTPTAHTASTTTHECDTAVVHHAAVDSRIQAMFRLPCSVPTKTHQCATAVVHHAAADLRSACHVPCAMFRLSQIQSTELPARPKKQRIWHINYERILKHKCRNWITVDTHSSLSSTKTNQCDTAVVHHAAVRLRLAWHASFVTNLRIQSRGRNSTPHTCKHRKEHFVRDFQEFWHFHSVSNLKREAL